MDELVCGFSDYYLTTITENEAVTTKTTPFVLDKEQENKIKFDASEYARHFINGYLDAVLLGCELEKKINNQKRSQKATNGRRLLGAATRERVKKEAEKIRFTTTKSVAANIIGDIVSKDRGTIARYLTEMFPGDKWKSNASHDT